MSTPRQSVVKANPAPAQSRSEAARPPKPAAALQGSGESEPSAYRGKFDEIKKRWYDTVAELKKVTWPDRETTKNLTLIVIAVSTVLGLLLGGIDWVMQQLFALL